MTDDLLGADQRILDATITVTFLERLKLGRSGKRSGLGVTAFSRSDCIRGPRFSL